MKNLKILSIGNSFSDDAQRYLYQIARAGHQEMKVVNAYIGGCSLHRHYTNMLSGERGPIGLNSTVFLRSAGGTSGNPSQRRVGCGHSPAGQPFQQLL